MKSRIALLTGLAALTFAVCAIPTADTEAVNRVTIESRQVYTLACFVQLGIFFDNDVALEEFTLPLRIMSTSGGAFWWATSDTLPWVGRFLPTNNGTATAPMTSRFYDNSTVDYVSPDFVVAGAQCLPADPPFHIGADAMASIIVMFDVNGSPGTFEIDTLFYAPSHNYEFIEEGGGAVVAPLEFVKGVVTTVVPPCPSNGDINCDCAINVLDAVALIDYVFRSGPPPCDKGLLR